jgi:hypothetical protein
LKQGDTAGSADCQPPAYAVARGYRALDIQAVENLLCDGIPEPNSAISANCSNDSPVAELICQDGPYAAHSRGVMFPRGRKGCCGAWCRVVGGRHLYAASGVHLQVIRWAT